MVRNLTFTQPTKWEQIQGGAGSAESGQEELASSVFSEEVVLGIRAGGSKRVSKGALQGQVGLGAGWT